jgi:metal-responsive CopG/Arc/MetJ family transcriptional regulator
MSRKILNISLPKELYDAVDDLAAEEGKSKGELTREIIREYIAKRERWAELRKWGTKTADEMRLTSESEIEEIVHQARKGE